MGIPYYFKKITDEYPEVIKIKENFSSKFIDNIDLLYLDFNCCIYGCVNELKKNDIIYQDDKHFEKDLINEVIKYIHKIYDFINPTKLFYISIDGIPPRSKIIQQRNRRYMKFWRTQKINKNSTNYEWDTNNISPGTSFMNNLSKEINYLITTNNKFKNIKSILSDSIEEGEGEFKIFKHIENYNNDTVYNTIIYGLDADLIMLSMLNSEKMKNISFYLLREPIFLDIKDKDNKNQFIFLDISKYIENVKYYYNDYFLNEKNYIIYNFIFLCFFLGNDFVPHLSFLNFKNDGLEILLFLYRKISHQYKNICPNILIINNNTFKINYLFINYLLQKLSEQEEQELIEISNLYYSKNPYIKRCNNKDEYELQKLELYPLFNKPIDKILIGQKNWQKRYYYENFNLKFIEDSNEINNLSLNYLESIVFTFEYYFYKKYHKTWFYHYNNCALIKDISLYLNNQLILTKIHNNNEINNNNDDNDNNEINNNNDGEINYDNDNNNDDDDDGEINDNNNFSIELNNELYYPDIKINTELQLLMILPPQSMNILSEHCRKIMMDKKTGVYHYFPKNFDIDINYKHYLWLCNPILPFIDLKKLFNIYNNY